MALDLFGRAAARQFGAVEANIERAEFRRHGLMIEQKITEPVGQTAGRVHRKANKFTHVSPPGSLQRL